MGRTSGSDVRIIWTEVVAARIWLKRLRSDRALDLHHKRGVVCKIATGWWPARRVGILARTGRRDSVLKILEQIAGALTVNEKPIFAGDQTTKSICLVCDESRVTWIDDPRIRVPPERFKSMCGVRRLTCPVEKCRLEVVLWLSL